MKMYISHTKSFNISFALATLAHMLNMYEICLNTTNYLIFNIFKISDIACRPPFWTVFGQLVSPPWIMIDISYTALHAWLDKDCRSPGMILATNVVICIVSLKQNINFSGKSWVGREPIFVFMWVPATLVDTVIMHRRKLYIDIKISCYDLQIARGRSSKCRRPHNLFWQVCRIESETEQYHVYFITPSLYWQG